MTADAFVCRREGHKPAVTITHVSGLVDSFEYETTCVRCGKWFTVSLPMTPPPVLPTRSAGAA